MSFFFSSFSISSHWELHWPVKFERYLVFVHCIKIDPHSFDYSLFCFESFFIDFFFNFIPSYLVSFDFYIKFGPHSIYCYLFIYLFFNLFLFSI